MDGHGPRPGGGIRLLAGMERAGVEAVEVGFDHGRRLGDGGPDHRISG